jgi:CRP/FNR family cyclic AMP-dependent transcriptional regulator
MSALSRSDKIWYLRRHDFLAGLKEAELQELAERTQMREFQRGKVILHPDSRQELVYLIKEGRVKISRYSSDGREQILTFLQAGDLFGELALIRERESVHIEAFEDTLICTMPRTDFAALLERRPELMLHVIKAMAERLRQAEEEIADLVFRDVPGRIAALLLRLGEEYGEREPDGQRLTLRLTHQDIASMVGATRETVTTTLSRFREAALIATDQRHIVILQPDRLRTISGQRRHPSGDSVS